MGAHDHVVGIWCSAGAPPAGSSGYTAEWVEAALQEHGAVCWVDGSGGIRVLIVSAATAHLWVGCRLPGENLVALSLPHIKTEAKARGAEGGHSMAGLGTSSFGSNAKDRFAEASREQPAGSWAEYLAASAIVPYPRAHGWAWRSRGGWRRLWVQALEEVCSGAWALLDAVAGDDHRVAWMREREAEVRGARVTVNKAAHAAKGKSVIKNAAYTVGYGPWSKASTGYVAGGRGVRESEGGGAEAAARRDRGTQTATAA